MTAALDRATAALGNANVRAFLHVIREGESDQTEEAYTVINGGGHFQVPPWAHPYAGQSAPPGKAAGAYQFIPHTWQACAGALGLADFSPPNQDAAATHLIIGRGALDAIEQANLVLACSLLKDEWVSLPGLGMQRIAHVFMQYGGTLLGTTAQPSPEAPQQEATSPPTQQGSSMGALMFLPAILQAIPELISALGKGPQAQKNAGAAQIIADTITKAAGTDGIGAALDKMANDPTAAASIKQQVLNDPAITALTEVGGGVVAARDFDLKQQAAASPFYKSSAVFWMSVLLLPIVYWLVGSVIVGDNSNEGIWKLFGNSWTGESRAGAFNLVIGLILGGICGVYFGVSVTQQRQQANQ